MGIAPNLKRKTLRLPVALLAPADAQGRRQLHQMLPPLKQATVGRVRHGLLHHPRADDDLVEALFFDHLAAPGRFDGFAEQPFHSFSATRCRQRACDDEAIGDPYISAQKYCQ